MENVNRSSFDFEPPMLLVEKATNFLTELIIEGQLKPGESVSEIHLNRVYGISRSPIREALRILEARGLVASIPRKGAYVKMLTKKDIKESFPIRAVLEGYAARLAIENFTKDDIREFTSTIEGMRTAANADDFKSFLKQHYRFHLTYIKASNNGYLITILNEMLNQALWLHQAYKYFQQNAQYSIDKHLDILNAFINKSKFDGERLVVEHILAAVDSIADCLSEVAEYGK